MASASAWSIGSPWLPEAPAGARRPSVWLAGPGAPQPGPRGPYPPGPGYPSGYPEPQKSKTPWIVLGVALALAIGTILGLTAVGVLGLGGKRAETPALQAQGAQPNEPILQVPGNTAPPVLPRETVRRVMPDDVRAWLEHLEKIERMRVSTAQSQIASAATMLTALRLGGTLEQMQGLLDAANDPLDTPTPTRAPAVAKAEATLGQFEAAWNDIVRQFELFPPPNPCVPIRNAYDRVLRETRTMILDIFGAIKRSEEDSQAALQSLMAMQGQSARRIGEPARQADELVAEICAFYETRKWFNIVPDVGGGLLQRIGF
ncbi:MAG: hypothetical protein SNJ74_01250 [Fimbriimonadaceae bacterium]